MGSASVNALTAPDAVTPASTLLPGTLLDHVNIDVVNGAIYWQWQQADAVGRGTGSGTWQPETYMAPGSRSIARTGLAGFRFRAAIAAASLPAGALQAVVTVEGVW